MSAQTTIVNEVNVKEYNLSVTTRDSGDDWKHLEEITYRTGVVWLIIAGKLEVGDYTMAGGSVEDEYAAFLNNPKDNNTPKPNPPIEFAETFGEPRCTIWNTYRGKNDIKFHLNSNDIPQTAINTWMANQNAVDRLYEKYATVQQKVANSAPQSAPANAASASAKVPTNAPNAPVAPTSGVLMTKSDAVAKLAAGDSFKMKIVQIEKHSKDGADFYEFFEPYGGKAGKYSSTSVFVDNEIALNNGFIASLDTLGIKLGQALTGNWTLNCAVGKPKTKVVKGEEKTFVNVYANSMEGQS